MATQKIIHIDMDAFFASVEQRDFADYQGKPIAIGHSPDERGVVATASYEARKFGVKSAMAMHQAVKLCPQLIIVKPRFAMYREISQQIRAIFSSYTDLVEPLSIDEAYLDVSDSVLLSGSATLIAKQILADIYEATQLTASAGVSYNKFLAKLASGMDKPAGITVILPTDALSVLDNLPVEKFHGIGPSTTKKLHNIGVFSGYDLRTASLSLLQESIGNSAKFYQNLAKGIDSRSVVVEKERKSISTETTFAKDIKTVEQLLPILSELFDGLWQDLHNKGVCCKTLTLKVKYADFSVISKSYTGKYVFSEKDSAKLVVELLFNQVSLTKPIRLLGVGASQLSDKQSKQPVQLRLFD